MHRIVKTEGCIVSGTTIDDVNVHLISEETKKDICDWIYNRMLKSDDFFQQVLSEVIDILGDYEYLYTCNQCGDSVYETKLDME